MRNIIFSFCVLLFSQGVMAQSYFKIPQSTNRIEYNYCHSNQNVIYDQFLKVLDSQISRLVYGLDEESIRSPEYKIIAYKKSLLDLIVKKIFVEELKRQFNINQLNSLFGNGIKPKQAMRNGKIFNLDELKIDVHSSIQVALTKAISNRKKQTLPRHMIEEFKKELIKELIQEFAKSAYKAVGSGLVAKVIAGTLVTELAKGLSRAALMSFGAAVIKGAVKGTILSILTAPLMGARKPPETIWREIYSKHPELILNPEWMKEAGSPDHPWMTHCASLMRKTASLEKALSRILTEEEGEFIRKMTEINEMRDPEEVRQEELYRYQSRATVRDNTYVKPAIVKFPKTLNTPAWAFK
jgi:hypothetical protein